MGADEAERNERKNEGRLKKRGGGINETGVKGS